MTAEVHPLINGCRSQRLPHAEPEHEAFSDLHGIPAGGPDPRLVVDAHADQAWPRRRKGLIDKPLKILLVGRPGAVGKAEAGSDGNDIRYSGRGRRLRAGDLVDAVMHYDRGEVFWLKRRDGRKT